MNEQCDATHNKCALIALVVFVVVLMVVAAVKPTRFESKFVVGKSNRAH